MFKKEIDAYEIIFMYKNTKTKNVEKGENWDTHGSNGTHIWDNWDSIGKLE